MGIFLKRGKIMPHTKIRCRICFNCKVFIPIHPNNSINQTELSIFETNHISHMIQTVDITEVPKNYKCVRTVIEAEMKIENCRKS